MIKPEITDKTYPLSPCTETDYEKLLSFLDICFEKPTTHWFSSNMGHIFRPDPETISRHFIYKHKGEIKGAIGIYPFKIRIGEVLLKTAGIGSVSVHPEFRKRGLMTSMLLQVKKHLQNGSFDISCLDGDRFRYRMFGWDLGGKSCNYCLFRRDLHRLVNRNITINSQILKENSLPVLMKAYNQFPNRAERSIENFLLHLNRDNLVWLGAESARGFAYIVYDRVNNEEILELQGDTETAKLLLLKHCIDNNLDDIHILHPHTDDVITTMLQYCCTQMLILHSSQFMIIDTDSTWEKLMPQLTNLYSGKMGVPSVLDTTDNFTRHLVLCKMLGFPGYSSDPILNQIPSVPWWIPNIDKV
ncbi:Acetyltransferase [Chitinispirillum alkaliphilum]|nr:Acetyltransferase [Chitinispirillum alkaliphilum]